MQEDLTGFEELEKELAGLVPAGVEARRDAVLFEAGRAVGRRSARVWRGAAGVMMLMVIGMVAMMWTGHGQRSAGDSVARQGQGAPGVAAPQAVVNGNLLTSGGAVQVEVVSAPEVGPRVEFAPGTYLWLRNEVLAHGVGALPKQTGGGGASAELKSEFWQATPAWQRRAIAGQGDRS